MKLYNVLYIYTNLCYMYYNNYSWHSESKINISANSCWSNILHSSLMSIVQLQLVTLLKLNVKWPDRYLKKTKSFHLWLKLQSCKLIVAGLDSENSVAFNTFHIQIIFFIQNWNFFHVLSRIFKLIIFTIKFTLLKRA